MMEIRKVAHKSPDYEQLVKLRTEVLRIPLGLKFTQEELDNEDTQWHFGLFDNAEALACLVLVPQENQGIKMRQVCTQTKVQGKGLGKKLAWHAELFAIEKGFTEIYCHARKEAVPFYEKMAYQIRGAEFMEVGIPHYYMFKKLSNGKRTAI